MGTLAPSDEERRAARKKRDAEFFKNPENKARYERVYRVLEDMNIPDSFHIINSYDAEDVVNRFEYLVGQPGAYTTAPGSGILHRDADMLESFLFGARKKAEQRMMNDGKLIDQRTGKKIKKSEE